MQILQKSVKSFQNLAILVEATFIQSSCFSIIKIHKENLWRCTFLNDSIKALKCALVSLLARIIPWNLPNSFVFSISLFQKELFYFLPMCAIMFLSSYRIIWKPYMLRFIFIDLKESGPQLDGKWIALQVFFKRFAQT